MQEEPFPNTFGACECDSREALCRDVYSLCSASSSLSFDYDLLLHAVPGTNFNGPNLVSNTDYLVWNFNGRNDISFNWLSLTNTLKAAFLATTDDLTLSMWIHLDASTTISSSYLFSAEDSRGTRYFSLYEASRSRAILFYHRNALSSTDNGAGTQVALSFYYDSDFVGHSNGLRDGQWHFIALTVQYPTVTFTVDGLTYLPTQGNYYDQENNQVLLNRIDGVTYQMPGPILSKDPALVNNIQALIAGSFRGSNRYSVGGQIRMMHFTSAMSVATYSCLASCNASISAEAFPGLDSLYNPVTRNLSFTGAATPANYTALLNTLVYTSNDFFPPQQLPTSSVIEIHRVKLRVSGGTPA